jgi:hypothetical protein
VWESEGNIFDIPDLCRGVVIKQGSPEDEYRLCSEGAKVVASGVDATASVILLSHYEVI